MSDDRPPRSAGARLRSYVGSMILAGGVTLRQIGPGVQSSPRDDPPYVQILDDLPSRFADVERIDAVVLTTDWTHEPRLRTKAALN